MAKLKLLTASALLFCLYPITTSLYAETDAELMASGQWRDPKTGLIWMRCLVGQKWTGKTCTGESMGIKGSDSIKYMNIFNQAGGFAGYRDWRLPTIAELSAIRRCNKWRVETTYNSELTATGYQNIAHEKTVTITIPSGKGSNKVSVPHQCGDLIETNAKNDPRYWKINLTIFPGFVSRSSPITSQNSIATSLPTQANQPLWLVNFYDAHIAEAPNYTSSDSPTILAVRNGK